MNFLSCESLVTRNTGNFCGCYDKFGVEQLQCASDDWTHGRLLVTSPAYGQVHLMRTCVLLWLING